MSGDRIANPRISVIIPTHRRPDSLSRVLVGLSNQTFPASDFEVIIVLDGPSLETGNLLRRYGAAFTLQFFEQRLSGAPAARNAGAREARGGILLFLDDDIIPGPDLLASHYEWHRRERLVVFGGFRLAPDSPNLHLGSLVDWSEAHRVRCSQPGYEPCHTDVPDGNLSFRLEDWEKVGGWDEAFTGFGGDDDRELALRLVESGLRLQFEPRAIGSHYYCKSWRRYLTDARHTGRAHRYYFQKHPERFREFGFHALSTRGPLRKTLFRSAKSLPEGLFTLAESAADRLPTRPGRLGSLTGFIGRSLRSLYYARGFWDGGDEALAIYRQSVLEVPILAYHRITQSAEAASDLEITVKQFELQMTYLSRHGYQTISLYDLRNWQTSMAPLPSKPVVITFDDGYAGFLESAAPVLLKNGYKATIFVIAGRINGTVHWKGYSPLAIMGEEELTTLSRMGHDIQGHGVTHEDWTKLNDQEIRREVVEAAAVIRRFTGSPVDFVAYPFGLWTSRVQRILRSAGVLGALTIQPGRNSLSDDPFQLHRNLIMTRGRVFDLPRTLYL